MIQSVERAAAILAALGSGTPRLGVTEIAERVGLAKPTVYGLLRTLEKYDLVTQDPETSKYSLGPGVLQLGNAYLDGSELRARSLLWSEALAQRANEAVWVATLSGSRVIVLHHVFRPDNTVQILEVGAPAGRRERAAPRG
jgi:DNA-binding IclR family transcriptional regulator